MLLNLASKNLRSRPFRTVIMCLGLAIAIAALSFFQGLTDGLKNTLTQDAKQHGQLNEINIKAERESLNFLNPFGAAKNNLLTEDDLNKIRQIPHVNSVIGESSLQGMSSLQISMWGQTLQTDTMIFGVPWEIITDLNPADPSFTREKWETTEEPVPAIVSSKLLELYNFSLAPSNSLPLLDPKQFIGTELTILPNSSTFFGSNPNGNHTIKAKIIGFSDKVNLVGVSISPQFLQKLNQQLFNTTETKYFQAHAIIDDPKNIPIIKDQLTELKFKGSSLSDIIAQIERNFLVFSLIFSIISLAMLLIAALLIGQAMTSHLNERLKEFGILKAIGLKNSQIGQLILLEAALIGFCGGLLGLILGNIAGFITNYFIISYLAQLNITGLNFFLINPLTTIGTLIFATLWSMLASLPPTQKIIKLSPLQGLLRP